MINVAIAGVENCCSSFYQITKNKKFPCILVMQ